MDERFSQEEKSKLKKKSVNDHRLAIIEQVKGRVTKAETLGFGFFILRGVDDISQYANLK